MNMIVTKCEGCPLLDESDWGCGMCEHPDSDYNPLNETPKDRFEKCPLRKEVLTIELKQDGKANNR